MIFKKIRLILLCLSCSLWTGDRLFSQEKKTNIGHEFTIGGTGQLYFEAIGMRYYNLFKNLYDPGGSLYQRFPSIFFPKFCFSYSRYVNKKIVSLGFNYYENGFYEKDIYRLIYYNAMILSYAHHNLIKSSKFSIRPLASLQLNYSYDYKFNQRDSVIYYGGGVWDELKFTFGTGLNLRLYFFKNFVLSNDFQFMFHLRPQSYFIQHNISVGFFFGKK